MKPVIEVKNISKSYMISHQANQKKPSIGSILKKTVLRPLGGSAAYTKEQFWALRDISFNVNQGEIFGVLGKNGSGKSTLLKILSRIVDPTEGEVTMTGRVASLLEVGTGFHPELTGRENVFLNGSMLGLSRQEIIRKFDEIVAFSEVEKFLDTPVKFYSSGMYVRLAFSVAAHLEPDILILDEVLAVGDAAFQKKSLNKILSILQSGCTVLMVSHSAENIRTLCSRGILLENGHIKSVGKIDKVLLEYKKSQLAQLDPTSTQMRELIVHYSKINNTENLSTNSTFEAEVEFTLTKKLENCFVNFLAEDTTGKFVIHARTSLNDKTGFSFDKGKHKIKISFPRLSLNPGAYSSWFRFTTIKEYGEYAVDTERKEFEVIGERADKLSAVDVPVEWVVEK